MCRVVCVFGVVNVYTKYSTKVGELTSVCWCVPVMWRQRMLCIAAGVLQTLTTTWVRCVTLSRSCALNGRSWTAPCSGGPTSRSVARLQGQSLGFKVSRSSTARPHTYPFRHDVGSLWSHRVTKLLLQEQLDKFPLLRIAEKYIQDGATCQVRVWGSCITVTCHLVLSLSVLLLCVVKVRILLPV